MAQKFKVGILQTTGSNWLKNWTRSWTLRQSEVMNVLIIFSVCVAAALVSYNIVECFVNEKVYSTSRASVPYSLRP